MLLVSNSRINIFQPQDPELTEGIAQCLLLSLLIHRSHQLSQSSGRRLPWKVEDVEEAS